MNQDTRDHKKELQIAIGVLVGLCVMLLLVFISSISQFRMNKLYGEMKTELQSIPPLSGSSVTRAGTDWKSDVFINLTQVYSSQHDSNEVFNHYDKELIKNEWKSIDKELFINEFKADRIYKKGKLLAILLYARDGNYALRIYWSKNIEAKIKRLNI